MPLNDYEFKVLYIQGYSLKFQVKLKESMYVEIKTIDKITNAFE